jgi:hypothetical protein
LKRDDGLAILELFSLNGVLGGDCKRDDGLAILELFSFNGVLGERWREMMV